MNKRAAFNSGMLSALAVAILALTAPVGHGQATPATTDDAYVPTFTFDVVSIRESKIDFNLGFRRGGSDPPHSSGLSFENMRAVDLVEVAYGIDSRHISGGPDWSTSTCFNVQAKSDVTVDDALAKLSDKQAWLEKQHMLQMMLADRFQLKVHQVIKEATNYELTIAKNGPKFQETKLVPANPDQLKDSVDPNKPDMQEHCGPAGCEMTMKRYPMTRLAIILGGQFNTNVVDKTGLTGVYDFTLKWRGEVFDDNADATSWPPLLTALPEQTGLQLKPVKGTRVTLVIDHIEKPSEN
jgi:uncharacterized protein (TIGR03435 family)